MQLKKNPTELWHELGTSSATACFYSWCIYIYFFTYVLIYIPSYIINILLCIKIRSFSERKKESHYLSNAIRIHSNIFRNFYNFHIRLWYYCENWWKIVWFALLKWNQFSKTRRCKKVKIRPAPKKVTKIRGR